jgi:hypothetical protein
MILARRGGGELGADGARRGQVEDFGTSRGGGETNFWLTRGSLIHIQLMEDSFFRYMKY